MNIDKSLSLISKEIEKIEVLLSKNNDELDFFDKVIVENRFSNVSDILNINLFDIMVAYLCIDSKEYSYEDIKERLIKNKGIITSDMDILEKLLDYIEYKDTERNKNIIEKFKEKRLKKYFDVNEDIDSDSFKELCDNNEDHLFEILSLVLTVEEMKEQYQEMMQTLEEGIEEVGIRVSQKDRRSILNETLREGFDIPRMSKTLNEISAYYQKLKTEDKQVRKELRKKLKNYNELLRVLCSIESKGISNVDINKVLSYADNEEIQKEFLYQVNIIQKNEFDKLNYEYSVLSVDNQLEVQAIFNDYSMDFDRLTKKSQNKVLVLDKEELKLLLVSIKEYTSDYELFDYLLLNSNYNILKHMTSLIKRGIITLEFIISNRSLLSESKIDGNNYYDFVEILEFLKEENINPHMFINNLDVYLTNVSVFKNNVEILKQYNLLNYLKVMNDFSLLTTTDLIEKIDMLLELGYEKLLEENIGLLNRDKNRIKRLYILKSMSLLPIDMESLIVVLDDPKFLSFTDNLDSYIFNIVDYRVDMSNIEFEEKTEKVNIGNNSRIIKIDDISLSRNRVRRNMLKLRNSDLPEDKKILYSYVLGTILSEEEYDKINSYLKTNGKQYSL